MRKSFKMKVGAVGTTFALAGALAVVASGTTGAYFSETKTGVITGNAGSIHIVTSGGASGVGDGLNFSFNNLMPGEAQTAKVDFTNTGSAAQDVFLTFPNVPALHAMNNLGSFGEVNVVDGGGTLLFHSTNLNDDRPDASGTCGTFTPAGCWPLPAKLKVASHVAVGASGSVSFSFNYPAKKTGGQGLAFNHYPSPGAVGADLSATGDGLPFNVVAVQVGQTP